MISALCRRASLSSKIMRMTRGMMPKSSSLTPMVYPLPIVNVFPEPVWPYARIVALKPTKQPRTKFRTHVSKTDSYAEPMPKVLSKVNARSLPIMIWSSGSLASTHILEPSRSSLPMRGLTRTATRTEHALASLVSAKKPFGLGFVSACSYSF